MPYTHFRMIAYEVPTVTYGAIAPVISGWDPGQECRPVARIPVPDGVEDDARIRLKRLASVVDFARERLQVLGGDHDNTLKILIVPEFYFRPPALAANYAHNTYPDNVAVQIFKALNQMFVHADFRHWLFVCGTVMWNTLNDVMAQPVYFNTAIHVWGGRPNAIGLIEKRLASGIDGVPVARSPGAAADIQPIFADWATRRLHVFHIDGIPLGLEVCLDHLNHDYCRVLRHVLADWPGREGNHQGVKLHVLTAGGMPIHPGSVCAQVGGYILRNDGMASPGERSQLQQVQSYSEQDPLMGLVVVNELDPNAETSANLVNVAPAERRDLPPGRIILPMPGADYNTFTQRLVYYPALPVPN